MSRIKPTFPSFSSLHLSGSPPAGKRESRPASCQGACRLCQRLTIPLHQFAAALGQAVDARDHYTRCHSTMVAELAAWLAQALALPAHQCQEIHVAGHLHDIGKIGVSDQVLGKTGPLSAAEWREMKQHPLLGHAILAHVQPLAGPGSIAEMVLHHHERYDGKGYPHGLAAERIPPGARVLAVADAFSAMIDDRPYRPGRSLTEAMAELEQEAGQQFDPEVVAVFLARRQEVRRFWQRWQTAANARPVQVDPPPAQDFFCHRN